MSIKVKLSDFQCGQLGKLFKQGQEAADAGRPGMTLAQLYIGSGEMICGFVNREHAVQIQEIMNPGFGGSTTRIPEDREKEPGEGGGK